MCNDEEVEVIDLDAADNEYTSDGINKHTGEYNPDKDAWYPDFKVLKDTLKEVKNENTYF